MASSLTSIDTFSVHDRHAQAITNPLSVVVLLEGNEPEQRIVGVAERHDRDRLAQQVLHGAAAMSVLSRFASILSLP
jgi:hypothetical protein